jgi:hypothetical protein
MFNSNDPQEQLRRLYLMAIAAACILIVSFIALDVVLFGWRDIVDGLGGNIFYGLGFWLAAGYVAGLVLGKMNAVVVIGNTEGRCTFDSAIDNLIVKLSCHNFGPGRLVQTQIANLWSGVLGVAIVYAICQLLSLVTGIAVLGVYPGSLVAVIPFVTVWKIVERRSGNALVRSHFERNPKR